MFGSLFLIAFKIRITFANKNVATTIIAKVFIIVFVLVVTIISYFLLQRYYIFLLFSTLHQNTL
jgi:hypothetical protein